jgi:chemotaxis protein MotB
VPRDAPRRTAGRVAAFGLLSTLVHVSAFGVALGVWHLERSNATPPSRLVLVDLVPVVPAARSGELLPENPSHDDTDTPAALPQRVVEPTAQNAELGAQIRDEQARTAQLEAQYRQQLAARDTAMSLLGHEMGALAADRDALSRALAAARERATALEQELALRRQAEAAAKAELEATYERLVSALESEIAARDVALERANARVTVTIVERVLFPSGQARLTSDGERVIDTLGAALAVVADRRILIEGHTDDVPIGSELRTRFASNWELSTARATAVVKRLIDRSSIPPGRLQAMGRADTDPLSTNETDEGRRLNRRIEIILLPLEDSRGDG